MANRKQLQVQKEWVDRIHRAKKIRSNWKDLFNVDVAKDYFDGRQAPPRVNREEWITVNKIYSHIKAQLPALYAADPYFYVKLRRSFSPDPKDYELWEKRGEIRQAYLNYLKESLDLKTKVRLAIQDAHFSYGVAKVYYEAETIDNPVGGGLIASEITGQPMEDEQGDFLQEPDTLVINGEYRIARIHPDDFVWDEDSGPLEDDWTWVAQRIRMPISEARENPLLNKKVLKSLEGKGETKDEEERDREERKKGDIRGRSEGHEKQGKVLQADDVFVMWEIYKIKERKWLIVAEEGSEPLLAETDYPAGMKDHPFATLRFTMRDDSPYPIPPLSQGIDPQREYNLLRSKIQTHRKRFNRKYEIVKQGVNKDTELSKLETGDDGTFIMVNMPNTVNPIKDAPLDPIHISELMLLNQDMIEVLGGSTDEARGLATADTATQAGILDKRLEIKEGDALSMVIDFVKVIARKLDMLVQTHIDKDEAIKVVGPDGEFWQIVKEEDYEEIAGEYEYSVNVGSTIPRMPQMERASWQAFLQLLGNVPQFMLSKRLMDKMAEMHHIEDEALIDELMEIGKKMMSGQLPQPGQQGSQAGVPEERPTSAVGGQAGGSQSLLSPTNGTGEENPGEI